ncbi:hypothetical protein I4F81_010570 [Pyropia yezoensis]|uniref:Uncharacterized protein n=1 Tax=Pyropia yezoensis TaxID=2788 RepID=A0ACC3CDP3_PYRYE|nr:hypothetical protein I4F81_010570 [Neopyropia yezoensis]
MTSSVPSHSSPRSLLPPAVSNQLLQCPHRPPSVHICILDAQQVENGLKRHVPQRRVRISHRPHEVVGTVVGGLRGGRPPPALLKRLRGGTELRHDLPAQARRIVHRRRGHGPRLHHHKPHAGARVRGGVALHKPLQRMLGRHQHRGQGQADQPRHRRRGDKPPAATGAERRQRRGSEAHRPEHVGVKVGRVPGGARVGRFRRRHIPIPRVANHHVQRAAGGVEQRAHRRLDGRVRRDVRLEDGQQRGEGAGLGVGDERVRLGRRSGGGKGGVAGGKELEGERVANARVGARQQHDLAIAAVGGGGHRGGSGGQGGGRGWSGVGGRE